MADRRLEDVLRLSDIRNLDHLLGEGAKLWPEDPQHVPALKTWLESARACQVVVAGPGLETFGDRVQGVNVLPMDAWHAQTASLLQLGLARFRKGERDDPFAVEPLYLRASSAEVKWENSKKAR